MVSPVGRFAALSLTVAISAATLAQSWTQVWSDEFSTPGAPNSSNWGYETGANGWGNGELENYTSRTANASVDSAGNLVITALRDNYQNVQYSSARLYSKNSWTYGKFECRAKLPKGRGTWPAIWMLPTVNNYGNLGWPDNGEMDIMEEVGYDPNNIHCSAHCNLYNGGNAASNNTIPADVFNTYHAYALEWRPHELRMTVDGAVVLVYGRSGGAWNRWPFNHPFNWRLNVAIGGSWGGAQGVDNTIFPTSMTMDYVRVSKMTSTPYYGTPSVLPGKVQAEDFDNGGEGFAYHDTDTANNGGSTYRNTTVDIGTGGTPDGTPYVGWISPDEWLTYTVSISRNTVGTLSFNVASPNSGKSFEVAVDDTIIASSVSVPNTGSWNSYANVSLQNVRLTAGTHQIRVMSNTDLWNFNSFSFVRHASKTVRGR